MTRTKSEIPLLAKSPGLSWYPVIPSAGGSVTEQLIADVVAAGGPMMHISSSPAASLPGRGSRDIKDLDLFRIPPQAR